MYTYRKNNSAKRGFALVELMVTITIIGILAAIIFARTDASRVKARDARRISDIAQVQIALETSFNNSPRLARTYPLTLNSLVTDGYAHAALLVDPTGNAYKYSPLPSGCDGTSTRCTSYCLGAKLENPTDPVTAASASCDVGDSTYTYKVTR